MFKKEDVVYKPSSILDPYKLYNEGIEAFEKTIFLANKKFSQAELNFKEPQFAAKSAIMSCYALYGINFYDEAESNLKDI